MKQLIIVISFLIIYNCPSTSANRAWATYYMAKLISVIQPNLWYVQNLYTLKREYLVIAATYYDSRYKPTGNYLSKFINSPHQYLCVISYGYDKYGRIVADIKALDRIQQLSYTLIVTGTCGWYSAFDPTDYYAQMYEQWAKQHHVGMWK